MTGKAIPAGVRRVVLRAPVPAGVIVGAPVLRSARVPAAPVALSPSTTATEPTAPRARPGR
ncbi:hypothetical protein MSZK_60170 [Mycobacterium sp. shizuoka-1]|nr:hypothetical protein MSZK_60170 [Mycobacterium sp. shizuoka-1]